MIGRLLSGRYRVDAVVGTGGMAVVYRAWDTQEERTVAIKVLRPEYEADMEFVRRFSHEAEAAAKMTHENIVNLLDVGMDGDVRYIVMEYVEGQTLKEMILEKGRIAPRDAVPMVLRILAAVNHAHRNNIVHRDIKPQNILVDRHFNVKVADFGIARLKTQGNDESANQAMGSVHYLSPEQARGELADVQSDIYSVGVVLYEMLTGHVPFDSETIHQVILMQVGAKPRPMRSYDAHIPKALDDVVMRALCKDKSLRYQSAPDMAADLRKAIFHPWGNFVVYPRQPQPPKSEPEPEKPQPHHTHDAVKAIAAMLVICTLVGLGFQLRELLLSVRMPQLLGHAQAEAVNTLRELGFEPELVGAYSEEYAPGQIMMQSKAAGERVREGTGLTLTVSLGSQWYQLEDMRGWDRADAEAALSAAGVLSYSLERVLSDAPADTVISVNVEPGWVSRETAIVLQVSGQSVTVPDLMGMSLESARSLISAGGMTLGEVSEDDSADARAGSVIAQGIAPQTRVLAGTALDLTLCRDQGLKYTPDAALTLSVPLNDIEVRVELVTPNGDTVDAYRGILPEGTHRLSLTSDVPGRHTINIYYADTLFETLSLDFI